MKDMVAVSMYGVMQSDMSSHVQLIILLYHKMLMQPSMRTTADNFGQSTQETNQMYCSIYASPQCVLLMQS